MSRRALRIVLILSMILSLLPPMSPAYADNNPFPSPDIDGDGLSNALETSGWYNLLGGPFLTSPGDADSDNDGLTDGEEKLFNTNPLDAKSPGIFVRYEDSFLTKQYFSVTDPDYLSMTQGGDRYLMTQAMVVRRGATFNLGGPVSATLTFTGAGLTPLTPIPDPARGGWTISAPSSGTVGTYTATLSLNDGWSKRLPIHVIFELPTDLSPAQTATFLYDDNSADKRDEVAVIWRMPEWSYSGSTCYITSTQPCSSWQYHVAKGYAEAFWTEQFKKKVLVDNVMPAMRGKTNQTDATNALANWSDKEFRVNYNEMRNSWTSAMYRWNDGTGVTMAGGACETTGGVFTTMLRSAGIAARPFTMDYNKTAGHGESGQIGTGYEYDHSVMMWLNGQWKAERNYNGGEWAYYPWASGVTGIARLVDWPGYSGYYNDYYGDIIASVGPSWDWQTGTNGGGTVGTAWAGYSQPAAEFASGNINWDYAWDSIRPLEIKRSPFVDILNYPLWTGDGWAPSEWSTPPTSSPAGRVATQTYYLPTGVPSSTNPLENWPYNPKPTSCSPSTPSSVCAAFLAGVTSPYALQTMAFANSPAAANSIFTVFLPIVLRDSSKEGTSVKLGDIVNDFGLDQDNNGRFDELIVKVRVTSSEEGEYQLGGWLGAGDKTIRARADRIRLTEGAQTIQVSFDGREIGDNRVDGPYQVKALWIARPDQSVLELVVPEKMLDYRLYEDATISYKANAFEVAAATLADNYSHVGVDNNGNGLYDSITVNVGLNIAIPGTFVVEGDLYDGQGGFVGHGSWRGSDPMAALTFDTARATPPFTLEHLNLLDSTGPLLDSRYFKAYEINDLAGRIDTGVVVLAGRLPEAEIMGPLAVTSTHGFAVTALDVNGNGRYDKVVVTAGVTVTDHSGAYRIEGLLVDAQGTPVAWSTSDPQILNVGYQQMQLEFDGRMLYDRLPLSSAPQTFKLIAVKIFSGNLSNATLEDQVQIAVTTPAYTRNQFEPSSPAENLFQDDMESGADKWSWAMPLWSSGNSIWHTWSHAWLASASTSINGSLALSPTLSLNLSNYAAPMLRFNDAYRMLSANDRGNLEVSTNGLNWTKVATYTGSTAHWATELVDLSAFGKIPNVQFRFNAQAQSGLLWYVDDVYLNAWPAVTSASYTYSPQPIEAGGTTTFTANYTSITTTLPVTYTWNIGGSIQVTHSPTVTHRFPTAGDYGVSLTVQNPYDTAVTSQTIHVNPSQTQYTLTVNGMPNGGGVVAKSPNQEAYNPGDLVTLTPNPAAGYTFSSWSGACTGSAACVVTMDGNKTVTATFIPIEYTLIINTVGTGTVAQNPAQATYHYGDVVQLTATPTTGWSFSLWSGDVSGSGNPSTITIDGNKAITATFIQSGFSLVTSTVGSGSVAKVPDQATYASGQVVQLTATPATGWSFFAWSDACTGNGACTVMMDGDKSVTATFTQNAYTLGTSIVGQGTIAKTPEQSTYTHGQVVTVTATPATGWSLSAWSGACTGTGACVVTMDGNKTVTATFTQNEYILTVTTVGNGNVSRSNVGPYHYGDSVVLTPTAPTGWTFTGWSGGLSGSANPASITMDGDKSVTATFTRNTYTLTITTVGVGTVNLSSSGPYYYGDIVQLTASPTSGWSFVNWSGSLSGNTNPVTITMDGNKSVTATFNQDTYTLMIATVGNGTVSKDPNQATYVYHEIVLMTAIPDPGWSFSQWSGDRTGTANPMQITMYPNKYVTATFTQNQYTLASSVVGQGTVAKTPNQSTYTYGQVVTVTGTPATGWSFSAWSGACTGNGACVMTIDGNKSVTATFTQNLYGLTVTTVGQGVVSRQPDQLTYTHGMSVQLTATADTGWEFSTWSGSLTGNTNPATITMDGNKAVTATFAEINCYVPDLIAAIEAANSNGQPTTITLNENCTYDLTSAYAADPDGYGPVGLPPITGNMTLVGNNTTIARSGAAAFRLFYVAASGNLKLEAVTLSNGLAQGGNGGNAQFDGGGGGGGMGGAIFNRGALTLTGVTLTGNTALGGNGGNDASGAPSAAGGGGMGGNGQGGLGNNLGGAGGGINGGAGGIDGSNSGKPGGVGGGGGGAANLGGYGDGGNGGFGGGGGGGNTVSGGIGGFGGGGGGNQGTGSAGGFAGGNGAIWTGGGGGGLGGAIFNEGGTLTLIDCTLSNNTAQGGNGTLGSSATGGGGSGYGGGVFNHQGELQVTDPVFANNTAVAGTGGVSGMAAAPNIYDLYTLSTTVGGNGTITKSPDQTSYLYGTEVTLTPTPATGWTFSAWSGACTGSGPCVVTMEGNKSVTATFTQNEYTLGVTMIGQGTVAKSPDQETYAHGTEVTLTPTPATGWTFSAWSGACTGSGPCVVTMDENKSVTATFTQNEYPLDVTIIGQGTVTKSPNQGTYAHGTEVTLTPTSATGWTFSAWSGACTGSGPCVVTMDENKSVTATFTENEYTLTVTAVGHGSVTQSPQRATYHYGDVVQLTATADTGWTFANWSGDLTSSANPTSITMGGNKAVTATFTQDEYTLTVTTVGNGSVSHDPFGPYHYGEVVDLTATPALGWSFANWSGDLTGSANPTSITMDGNKSVTATFTQNEYALGVTIIGQGTVAKSPDQGPYAHGTEVTLTPTPATGWNFSAWSGACTGSGPCVVTMDENKSVVATFTQNEYTLTVTAVGHGSVTQSPQRATYHLGDKVTLTATPDPGYAFNGWSGDHTGTVSPVEITVTGDMTIAAGFTQNEYTLGVTIIGQGTVAKSPDQGTYAHGTEVNLTPTPATGWTFSSWSGACTGSGPCVVTMDGNKSVTATFTENEYTLGVTIIGQGTVAKSPDQGIYAHGTEVTLTPTPATGWTFFAWSGACTGSGPCVVTMDENKSVVATFTQNEYTLTVTAVGHGSVAQSPQQGTYHYGDVVQLTATADTGWTFANWSGNLTGATNPQSITLDGNKSVTATFTQNQYVLTVVTDGTGTVTKTPDQETYTEGQSVYLTPESAAGWSFGWWGGACTGPGSCEVTMYRDVTVTAYFIQDEYTLDVYVNGNGTVAKDPDQGSYLYGTPVTLTPSPAPGWSFAEWGGACTGSQACMVTMDGNKNVTASFTQNTYTLTVNADPAGSGTVNRSIEEPYTYGEYVNLTAAPTAGWIFIGWSGDLISTDNPAGITMVGNKIVTATFALTGNVTLPKNLLTSAGTVREPFDTLSNWTVQGKPSGYSAVTDTLKYKEGTSSLKLTTPTTGYVQVTKSINWSLTDPADQGNFRLWVYAYGAAVPTGGNITLSNDSAFKNYFIASAFTSRIRPGWNLINLRASDWKVGAGSPSWTSPLVRIRIRLDGTTSNSYSFDGLTSGVVAQPAVLFTFDESQSSLYTQAFAYMQSHNVRGTGYIATDWVDGANRVTWAQLQAMYAAGWTIGNNTLTGTNLTGMSLEAQQAALAGARSALGTHGMTNVDYVAYPAGSYNANTLTAMGILGMRTGRTLLSSNIVSPLGQPFEISQQSINRSTTLATAQGLVATAKTRQEILVITLHGISTSPGTGDWYVDRFQQLVDYCITQGIPIITMDDLYQLGSGAVTIPGSK